MFWGKKIKPIDNPGEPIGLIELKVGKNRNIDDYTPILNGASMSYTGSALFKIIEVKRFENNKSEVKILECKNNLAKVVWSDRTYVVDTNKISWSQYDPAQIYKEYMALKNSTTFKPNDFNKNLEEFKSILP